MITENLAFIFLIFAIGVLLAIWYFQQRTGKKARFRDTFLQGLKAIVTGDRKKAMKLLRENALADTANIDAYVLLGDLVREEGSAAKALQIHRSALSRATLSKEQSARILKSLALDYTAIEDHDKAIEALNKALERKRDRWTEELLLEELEKKGKWEEAFELLSKFSSDNDKKKELLALYKVMIGNSTAETGNYHKARVLFKDAIRIDKDCKPAYMRIGDAYYADDRVDDAVEWWMKFTVKFPDIAWCCFERLERAAYEQKDFGRMIVFYSDFINEHPEVERAKVALAGLYERMGRLEDAIDVLDKLDKPELPVSLRLLNLIRRRDNIDDRVGKLIENLESENQLKLDYKCSRCGYVSPGPIWYCFECGAWNSYGI